MLKFNIDLKNKINSNFPYLVENNFIDELDLENLNNTFPYFLFDKIDTKFKRKNINFKNKHFQKFCNGNTSWQKLSNLIYSKNFAKKIIDVFIEDLNKSLNGFSLDNPTFYCENIFKDDLKKQLNFNDKIRIQFSKIKKILSNEINYNKIKIHALCAQSISTYGKNIHLDGRSKLIVGLFYLNDMEGLTKLNLYKKNSSKKFTYEKNNFIEDRNVDILDSIEIKKNKLVLFANTPLSFHGVNNSVHNKKRNFIYFSFGYESNFSPWKI